MLTQTIVSELGCSARPIEAGGTVHDEVAHRGCCPGRCVHAVHRNAQDWPTKQPIKIIVPFSAGSATDITARTVFDQVGKQIGQTIVVENRGGAGTTLGASASSPRIRRAWVCCGTALRRQGT
jgi:Tripartite tricarboxylate transporter family receptor